MTTAENQNQQIPPPSSPSLDASDTESGAMLEAYALGRTIWPELTVTHEQFRAQAARANGGSAKAPACAADFYLSVACANADEHAHAVLEARYFPTLVQLVRATITDSAAVDDVMQEVRLRLLAGPQPKIGSYRGQGSLAGWLRRVAVHAARDHFRVEKIERRRQWMLYNAQNAELRASTSTSDERLDDRGQLQGCEHAWRKALQDVGTGDLDLLQRRFALGMSIDALSPLYAVHRATIARRVQRVAHRMRRVAREALGSEHQGLSPRELDAMMCEWSSRVETVALQR